MIIPIHNSSGSSSQRWSPRKHFRHGKPHWVQISPYGQSINGGHRATYPKDQVTHDQEQAAARYGELWYAAALATPGVLAFTVPPFGLVASLLLPFSCVG